MYTFMRNQDTYLIFNNFVRGNFNVKLGLQGTNTDITEVFSLTLLPWELPEWIIM